MDSFYNESILFLLFPVVPDVLHIVVIFHDVDELFHQLDVLFGLQFLVVLGDQRGKVKEKMGNSELFGPGPYTEIRRNFFGKTPVFRTYFIIQGQHKA